MDYLIKMRNIARKNNLKMHDLASIFNKAPSTVNNYLNGKNDMPMGFFISFCDYFSIPYNDMLNEKQERQLIKFQLKNTIRENELMREISELKNTIIELMEKNCYYHDKSKAC
jgi:transcriptional regulator with XRE-family HTH domain